jgi:Fur family ferric uptake transcriptional regulator
MYFLLDKRGEIYYIVLIMRINIIKSKKKNLRNYLKENGMRLTRQRKGIIEYLCAKEGHHSAGEIYRELKNKIPNIGFATVYRTLHLLVDAGLASRRRFKDNITVFEITHGKLHHDHMICLGCGKIIEFKDDKIEKLQEMVAKKYSFRTESHTLKLYGYCKKCIQKGIGEKKQKE